MRKGAATVCLSPSLSLPPCKFSTHSFFSTYTADKKEKKKNYSRCGAALVSSEQLLKSEAPCGVRVLTAQNMDWTATSVSAGICSRAVACPCENHSDAWAGWTRPPAPAPAGVLGAAAAAPPPPAAAAAGAPKPTVGWRCRGVVGCWCCCCCCCCCCCRCCCPAIGVGLKPICTAASRSSDRMGSGRVSESSSSMLSGSSGTIGPALYAGPPAPESALAPKKAPGKDEDIPNLLPGSPLIVAEVQRALGRTVC